MNFKKIVFLLFNLNLIICTKSVGKEEKIHIFIHVCTLTCWESVLENQLKRINESGLYEVCDSISIGVLGTGNVASILRKYPKVTLLFQNPNMNLYERPTLLCLHDLCRSTEDECLVLYLHTKGVSAKHGYKIAGSVIDWRNLLEYFNLDCWRDCVSMLTEEKYDVCGVNVQSIPKLHCSGNFWWARSKYIASLPHEIGSAYTDPEMWVGLNNPRIKSLHNSNINHYDEAYPEWKYKRN